MCRFSFLVLPSFGVLKVNHVDGLSWDDWPPPKYLAGYKFEGRQKRGKLAHCCLLDQMTKKELVEKEAVCVHLASQTNLS